MLKLAKLRTLELRSCVVECANHFLTVVSRLNQLQLMYVRTRERPIRDPIQTVQGQDIDHARTQLEAMAEPGALHVFRFGRHRRTISRVEERLRITRSYAEHDVFMLQSHDYLQELHIDLPERVTFRDRGPSAFTILLTLQRLRKLTVNQTLELPLHWGPDPIPAHDANVEEDARALGSVLVQLSQLKSLSFSGRIDSENTLTKLASLEHLELGALKPALATFDWIRSYRNLRFLKIQVSSKYCDLSAIGSLSGLEEFDFDNREVQGGTVMDFAFLGQLVNVKRLCLTNTVHDLSIVRGMRSLEKLTLRSGWVKLPVTNVDVLVRCTRLHTLDMAKTTIRDVSALALIPRLRVVSIPSEADCMPLVDPEHPKLLRLLHPKENCLVACRKRAGRHVREQRHGVEEVSADDLSASMFADGGEDY